MNEPREQEAREDSNDRHESRRATFLQTVGAVFWSFFGVRKKSDYERDVAQLSPVHVIIGDPFHQTRFTTCEAPQKPIEQRPAARVSVAGYGGGHFDKCSRNIGHTLCRAC